MKSKIILAITVGLLGTILLISGLFDKKEVENVSETTIEAKITTDTTATNTTTTTTKKITKKFLKTTKKTTKAINRIETTTGSKAEYMAYAKQYGNLNDTQLTCLDYLWSHESGWNPKSVNRSSGACGIPQAYPCKKIAQSEGSNDWKAQIRWGIKYINGRYKNPCSAWNHFKNKKWY